MIRVVVALAFALLASAAHAQTKYIVGAWNLEHFKDGDKGRGFPETTIRPRTTADYKFAAAVIKELDAKILVLEEINGKTVRLDDGDEDERSPELEKLIGFLSADWDYVIASSGGTQRIAILYNTKFAQLNAACETSFPNIKVQKKGLFDRQPLYAHFTFLENGQERNDLVVVGVHLASGQMNNKNHDQAMTKLVKELELARAQEFCIPNNEFDVLIAGDFNANRFDDIPEVFWDKMEANGWDVLGDDKATYSPTRFSGKPLQLRESRIDYIIVSQGLANNEVTATIAKIHTELAPNPDQFRLRGSDHLPITVEIAVGPDQD
jgi:endonuclease/exonuclease/phosphatase family metal-dependent hydrolase